MGLLKTRCAQCGGDVPVFRSRCPRCGYSGDEWPPDANRTAPATRRMGFWRFVLLAGSPLFALALVIWAIDLVSSGWNWMSLAAAAVVGLLIGPVAAALAYAAGGKGPVVRACLGGLFGATCGAALVGGHPAGWMPGGRMGFALLGFAVGALALGLPSRGQRRDVREPPQRRHRRPAEPPE